MSIPVVDFYPKPLSEIPTQDNPVYGNEECIIITGKTDVNTFGPPRVLNFPAYILHFEPNAQGSVKRVAIFSEHKDAEEYADFLATKSSDNVHTSKRNVSSGKCICVDIINNNPDPVINPDCPTHGWMKW